MISIYCKCGTHFADGDMWHLHLRDCKTLRECLEGAPSVDIQYPDLGIVPPQLEETVWRDAKMPTWKLPARVVLGPTSWSGKRDLIVHEEQFAYLWALVIATQMKVDYQLRVIGLAKCHEGGVQAQKALIALLRIVPERDYGAAIHEFVTKIAR